MYPQNRLAASAPTLRRVNDDEREALQWLTVDELAARRRWLVRDYDRELRKAAPDPARAAAIRADAEAIDQVQRKRRQR